MPSDSLSNDFDKRLRDIETDKAVYTRTFELERIATEKNLELERKLLELESYVRTARYIVTVFGTIISLIGLVVSVYVSNLYDKIEKAKADTEAIQKDVEATRIAVEKTLTAKLNAANQQANQWIQRASMVSENADNTSKNLNNLFSAASRQLAQSAQSVAQDAVKGAAATILEAIPNRILAVEKKTDDLVNSLANKSGVNYNINVDAPIRDPGEMRNYTGFSCPEGSYVTGITTIFNNGLEPKEVGAGVSQINAICKKLGLP